MTIVPEPVKQVTASTAEKKESETEGDSTKTVDGSLNQAQLAERLGVNTSNVGRTWKSKGEEGFRVWSQQKDPESIAWRRCEKTGRYFKVSDELV